MTRAAKNKWLVTGFDGVEQIFEARLSSIFSENELRQMLRCLCSRTLSDDEIIAGTLRKRMKGYSSVLDVKKDWTKRGALYCGENPHYVAALFTEYELEDMDKVDLRDR